MYRGIRLRHPFREGRMFCDEECLDKNHVSENGPVVPAVYGGAIGPVVPVSEN